MFFFYCVNIFAYTPPFPSSAYFSGTINTLTDNNWYVSYMTGARWKDTSTQEVTLPSVMVDSSGNLYVLTYAGVSKYWDYRITKVSYNGTVTTKCHPLFSCGFGTTKYNGYFTGRITEGNNRWPHFWPNLLRPVIFQELEYNGGPIICAFPFPNYKYLTGYNDESIEGMCFAKIDRSSLDWVTSLRTRYDNTVTGDMWYHQYRWLGDGSCSDGGRCINSRHNYNEGIYLGYYNGNSDGQWIYCYQNGTVSNGSGAHSINNYRSNLSYTYVTHNGGSNGIGFRENSLNNDSGWCISSLMVEPRVIKHGSYIYFLATRGLNPRIARWNGSSWYSPTIYNVFSNGNNQEKTAYHFDFFVTGSDQVAILGFMCGNALGWETGKDMNWSTNKACLAILSGTIGSNNFSADPQNVLYVTNVDWSSIVSSEGNPSTSLYTLYKCTHKMVTYSYDGSKYLIYAYCYPGKTKQCILGYAQYEFDSNGKFRLLMKREFCDKSGSSFYPLNDCARIIDMTYRDSELWITWVTADECSVKYFHIRPSSFIGL